MYPSVQCLSVGSLKPDKQRSLKGQVSPVTRLKVVVGRFGYHIVDRVAVHKLEGNSTVFIFRRNKHIFRRLPGKDVLRELIFGARRDLTI